jgi:hypothetical protein
MGIDREELERERRRADSGQRVAIDECRLPRTGGSAPVGSWQGRLTALELRPLRCEG